MIRSSTVHCRLLRRFHIRLPCCQLRHTFTHTYGTTHLQQPSRPLHRQKLSLLPLPNSNRLMVTTNATPPPRAVFSTAAQQQQFMKAKKPVSPPDGPITVPQTSTLLPASVYVPPHLRYDEKQDPFIRVRFVYPNLWKSISKGSSEHSSDMHMIFILAIQFLPIYITSNTSASQQIANLVQRSFSPLSFLYLTPTSLL